MKAGQFEIFNNIVIISIIINNKSEHITVVFVIIKRVL